MAQRTNFTQNDLDTAARLFNAENGNSNQQVATILGCNTRSVTNLRKRMAVEHKDYVNFESYVIQKRGRKVFGEVQLEPFRPRLLELIAENPQMTREEMAVELGLTLFKLKKLINLVRISHKRAIKQPRTRNSPELILERQRFAARLVNIPEEERIFLDETGFNLHTQSEFGWAPRGMTPVIPVNPNRGRNVTLVVAISMFGIEAYTIFPGSCNGQKLAEFSLEQLNPTFRGHNIPLMLDNVRLHHSAIVRQSLEPEIDLRFLPAYSPQLNPIEEVFALVKYYYKRQRIRNLQDVVEGVRRAVQAVQARTSFVNYFRDLDRWIGRAFRSEEFPT